MKKTERDVLTLLRKSAIGMLAAVTAAASLPSLSAGYPLQANAGSPDELANRIQSISRAKTNLEAERKSLIAEFKSGKYTKLSEPVKFNALFVKCSDITVNERKTVNGEETIVPKRYVIGHDSDVNTVIEHGIARFEETVEEMTAGALDIVPTIIWLDDPVTVPDGGFGYNELVDTISEPIHVERYDSVFFFNAKEGVYSTTGRGVKDLFGESYIQTVCVADEIQKINDGIPMEEERKEPWTCGNITHEWIHQLDISAKMFTDAEHFPMCHDYVFEGGQNGINDLEQTTENGDIYLTNPQNGFKWKYVPGKYPDHLGDYYEALLSGEVIDTKDGNKKKGMFPDLWKYIRDYRDYQLECSDLGTYTFQNTKSGKYLNAENEKDRYGASKLTTVTPQDPFSANMQWVLKYDTESAQSGAVRLYPKGIPNEIIRAEKGDSVDPVALYNTAWGLGELENKNFAFRIVRTADGTYQIKSTLSMFSGYNLCDNPDGTVDLRQDNENGSWKLTRIDMENEDYCIKNLSTRGALTLNQSAAAIKPYAYTDGLAGQKWTLKQYGSGRYTISASGKNLCFTASGSKVTLTAGKAAPESTQLWQIRKDSDGFCRIVSVADPALCIAWSSSMVLQKTADDPAQLWDIGQPEKYAAIREGYYYLKTQDGKYLGGNDTKKDDILLVKSDKKYAWKISEKGNGYYWIECVNGSDTRLLDTADSLNKEGNSIRLCTDTSLCGDPEGASYAQHWGFAENPGGTYRLMPKLTFARGLRITDSGYSTKAVLSSVPDNFTLVSVKAENVVIPPIQTTTAPVTTTVNKTTTTAKPAATTVKPAATTAKPGATTAKSTTTSAKAAATTDAKPVSTMKGDANCDRIVDVSDAVLVARYCAEDKTVEISRQGILNADVDKNGKTEPADTVMILRFIAHILNTLD